MSSPPPRPLTSGTATRPPGEALRQKSMSSPPPVLGKRQSNTAPEFLKATFAVTAQGTWDED